MVEDGKKFDSLLCYLNEKLLEPSRLGNGKSSAEALEKLDKRISMLNNNIADALQFWDEKNGEDYSDSAVLLIEDLTSELDKIEAYGSNHGYICYDSSNSFQLDNYENSPNFISPNLQISTSKDQSILDHNTVSKRFVGKKLLFDGTD